MNHFILLPSGDAIANSVIKSVRYINERGVVCTDAQQRVVVWIPVADPVKGHRVRDILILFAKEPRGIRQPDWSFLNDEVPAVA